VYIQAAKRAEKEVAAAAKRDEKAPSGKTGEKEDGMEE